MKVSDNDHRAESPLSPWVTQVADSTDVLSPLLPHRSQKADDDAAPSSLPYTSQLAQEGLGGDSSPTLLPYRQVSMRPINDQYGLPSVSSDHQHLSSSGGHQQFNGFSQHKCQHHQQRPLSSVVKTFGNIIISIVGAGVLGFPYAFKTSGWLLSSIVIASIAFACYYCMMLLVWSRERLEKDGGHRVGSFSDLGFLLYGKWGRFAVDFILVLTQGAFCVAYLIFIGKNLASVFNGEDNPNISTIHRPKSDSMINLSTHVSAVHSMHAVKRFLVEMVAENSIVSGFFSTKEGYIWVVFPLEVALASIRSLTMLAPFSILADFASGISMAVVMQEDLATMVRTGILRVSASQGLSTLPFAIGVAIYAFEGVGLVIPLESCMKERKKFGRVLGLAMACITSLYIMFGLLGYLAYGDETLDIVTLNLGAGWKTTVVKVGLCVGLFFTFSVMMYPVHEVMEQRLAKGRPSMILRSLMVVATTVCAVAVPHFGDFLSLVGNSVCCTLAFVLPALFHIKAHKGNISRGVLWLDYVIITFGISYAVLGTIYTAIDTIAS